jgi:hypothetical protein
MKDRKFKFKFLIISDNITFVDQQVHQFSFINIGSAFATINNSFTLLSPKAIGYVPNNTTYTESFASGEKTAQEYKIIFDPTSRPDERLIQVIMKIEILDGK